MHRGARHGSVPCQTPLLVSGLSPLLHYKPGASQALCLFSATFLIPGMVPVHSSSQ